MSQAAAGRRVRTIGFATIALLAASIVVSSSAGAAPAPTRSTRAATPHVLLVGTYKGVAGQYTTIQAAVDAAQPGDWILVAPGDYHETADHQRPPTEAQADAGENGAVLITTPHLHLRGMDRSGVIVDGTRHGAPTACTARPAWQDLGVKEADSGKHYGRNGIVVFKADGVSVDNLTVCNFLGGSYESGNGIWWNGGANSGTIGMHGYSGRYLTATSTFFAGESTAAQYGIFSSDAAGPAVWDRTYANNFNDSGLYVGACKQVCDIVIDHAWMENNALGYSGTNSGGAIVVRNSEFDKNEDGFDTNTQIGGDPTAPQDGACPNHGISPITHTHSCWVFMHNYVHDNNNPNTPASGGAAAGPYGTGMTLSGARNDTVVGNTFADNGAWGLLVVPFPDSGGPSLGQTCAGTGGVQTAGLGCVYDSTGNAILRNNFRHNGYFGNPSNSDLGQIVLNTGRTRNCYSGNRLPDGSAPAMLQALQPTCGRPAVPNTGGPLLGQVLCDTGFGSCPAGAHYPTPAKIVMAPLPKSLAPMPDPCVGVPSNPWC